MASSVSSPPAGGDGVVTSELATIGQYTSQLGELTNAVDCGILCLTIIGAGGMIASMINKRYGSQKGTTVRSWLVLFLVFGDLCLGIIGLIPTAATLAGRPPRAGSAFCNSMGFLLAASVWAQHINTLMLCIATHFILIMPLSCATRLVEQYWYLSLPGVWATSFVLAGIGWAVQGSWGYNNGLCYYQPGLFSEIYQFVPRGIVFSIISVLYIRLFVFLRRPDLIRSSNPSSDPASLGSIQSRKWSRPLRWTRASGASEGTTATPRPGFWHRPSATSIMAEGAARSPTDVTGLDAYDSGGPRDKNVARPPATTAATQDNIPQWERLKLPIFVGADSVPTGWNGGLKRKSVFGGLATTFSGKSSRKPGTPLQNLPLPSPSIPSTPISKPVSSFKPRTPNALNPAPAFQNPHLAPELSMVPAVGSEDGADSADLAIRRGSHVSFLESQSQRPSMANSATSFPAPAFASASPSSASSPSQPVFSPNFSLSVPSALAVSTISSYTPPRSTTSPSFPSSVQIDLARSSPPPPTSAPASSSASGRRTSSTERLQPGSKRHRPSTPITSINQPSSLRESSAVDDSLDASASQRVSLPPFSQLEDASNSTADSQTPSSSSTRRSSAGTTESSALSPSTPSGGAALPSLTGSESTPRVKLSTISQKGELAPGTDEEQARKLEEDDSDDGGDDDDEEEVGGEPDEREELALRRVLELTEPGPNGEPNWGRSRRSKGSRGMSSSGRMVGSTSAEAGGGGGGDAGSGSWTGSGSDGTNKESMARFMNRKASLLMLSFPLAYVVLFSVSLIRIIYDFVRPNPNPALSAVARWMIFAQGLLDAIIYGIIEWNVKRTVRRKVRRGYSSPAASRWDTAAVSGGVFDGSFAGSGGAGGGGVSGGSTSFPHQRASVGRTTDLGVVS